MKTIVNTALISYRTDSALMSAASNSVKLHILLKDCLLQGEVVCRPPCHKWKVSVEEKHSGRTVFSLGGKQNKVFCFEPDAEYEYRLVFTADKNCTLRLYNIPDCVSNIIYRDNI